MSKTISLPLRWFCKLWWLLRHTVWIMAQRSNEGRWWRTSRKQLRLQLRSSSHACWSLTHMVTSFSPRKQKVTEQTERQRYTAIYLKLLSQWNTNNINMDYKHTRSIKGSTYYSIVNMLMWIGSKFYTRWKTEVKNCDIWFLQLPVVFFF